MKLSYPISNHSEYLQSYVFSMLFSAKCYLNISSIFQQALNSYTQITQCALTKWLVHVVDNKSWEVWIKFTYIQTMKLNLKGNQFAKGGHIKSVVLINGLIIISSSPTVQWLSGLCMMLDKGRMMAKCLILCSPNSYPNSRYEYL